MEDATNIDSIFDIAITFATVSLLVFTGISAHLSLLTRRAGWKWFFRLLAAGCMTMASFRGYAAITYTDGFYMHPVFPITGILSQLLVTSAAVAFYLFTLRTLERARLNREGQNLTDEIFADVVTNILEDKPVTAATIAKYKRRHIELVERST